VEYGGNNIGRITTVGTITEYPIPTPMSGPLRITAGPDGALWFTENGGGVGNNIGRITTAGMITEYATPTPNSGPYGITSGPDGALWFVEYGGGVGNKIGRITIGGAITEYALPRGLAATSEIIQGPDDALWFLGSLLGRITTAGVITSFDGVGAEGITAGPDGALWFTVSGVTRVDGQLEPGDGAIGRFALTGAVTQYSLTPSATIPPVGITLGPDGALWYAGGNLIGRAALGFPTAAIAAVGSGADVYSQTIQSNSWVAIYGSHLAPPGSDRTWGEQDIVDGCH
jgi:virginiamycin B lyase